jgi:hypothetical protein
MTFFVYADTGETYGPYGALPLAQKHARAKLVENNGTRPLVITHLQKRSRSSERSS